VTEPAPREPFADPDEPISVEIEALRGLLQEVAESPQSRFHARLAEIDGAEWFEARVEAELASLGAPGPVLGRAGRSTVP